MADGRLGAWRWMVAACLRCGFESLQGIAIGSVVDGATAIANDPFRLLAVMQARLDGRACRVG